MTMRGEDFRRFWTFDIEREPGAAPLALAEDKDCSDISPKFSIHKTRDEIVQNSDGEDTRVVAFSLLERGRCILEFQYPVSAAATGDAYLRAIQSAFLVNGDNLSAAMAGQ